jgi:hypothetical protein
MIKIRIGAKIFKEEDDAGRTQQEKSNLGLKCVGRGFIYDTTKHEKLNKY